MKKLFNMLHIIFMHARIAAALYLSIDILLCLVTALQLIILQTVVDAFTKNSVKMFVGGIILLSMYFVVRDFVGNLKERMSFQVEKTITLALGAEIADSVHSLAYSCYEKEEMYDIIEKISDKPYLHFIKAFFAFSRVVSISVQLIAIFIYLVYLSGTGVVVSICLILTVFFFDYRIMITSDELENDKIPEERMLKYYLSLFFEKNSLLEIKVLQMEHFLMDRIRRFMHMVYRKRLKISVHTQKYYGYSCLCLSLWAIWILCTIGIKVSQNIIPAGVFLSGIKMIDMISGLSGDFSEEYVVCGEELQKIIYYEKLKKMGELNEG